MGKTIAHKIISLRATFVRMAFQKHIKAIPLSQEDLMFHVLWPVFSTKRHMKFAWPIPAGNQSQGQKMYHKDSAELSRKLSGAICVQKHLHEFFGAVHAISWLCVSFLAPDSHFRFW